MTCITILGNNRFINLKEGVIMEGKPREQWSSRIGLIFAAAGSAVGLGNIWRFPYMTGAYGGSAFIIIYLACVLFIGLSIMIAEWTLGRRANLESASAYKKFNKNWTFAGLIGVLSAFLILGFYPVVGGWSLAYIFKSITGLLSSPDIGGEFGIFVSGSAEPLIWMLIYLAINIVIVARGVQEGLEKASKIMMPAIFVLFILVAIRSVTLEGAQAGLEYIFRPDWSAVDGQTFLAALGQAFFSMSLGMGIMITYGSYIPKDAKIPNNAAMVTLLDTGIALLAAIAIFPGLFAFGMEPTQGAGLVFAVVPAIFAEMGTLGPLFSVIFFSALTLAALTSSMSLLEVVVAYLMDEKKFPRKKAVVTVGIALAIMNILASLSMGVLSDFTIFGVVIFDFFDFITDKIFLAIGGLLVAIFMGWVMKKEDLKDELTNSGTVKFALFEGWYFLIKFVIPIAIAIVAVMGITSIEQTSLAIFGLAVIAALAIFSKKL